MANVLRVLGIAASPRRFGNTSIMLKAFLAGAESQGAMVKMLNVSSLRISYCEHCDRCHDAGQCAKDDDMTLVNEDLAWADIIAVATPTHFCSVPAQFKTLIDRTQNLWVRKYVLKENPLYPDKERHGYILAAAGRNRDDIFDCIKEEINSWFVSLNIDFCGMETASNLNNLGEVKERPETLERMLNLGKRAVINTTSKENYNDQ